MVAVIRIVFYILVVVALMVLYADFFYSVNVILIKFLIEPIYLYKVFTGQIYTASEISTAAQKTSVFKVITAPEALYSFFWNFLSLSGLNIA